MERKTTTIAATAAVGIGIMTSQLALGAFAPPRSWNFDGDTLGAVPTEWKSINTVVTPAVTNTDSHAGGQSVLLDHASTSDTNLGGMRFADGQTMSSRHGMVSGGYFKFTDADALAPRLSGGNPIANFEFYQTNLQSMRAGTLKIQMIDADNGQLLWTHGDNSGTDTLATLTKTQLTTEWTKLEIRVDIDNTDGTEVLAYQVMLNDSSLGVRELHPNANIVPGGANGNWLQDNQIAIRNGADVLIDSFFVNSPMALTVPEPASAALLGLVGCGLALRRRSRA